jgi:DNA-binding protein Fis
MAEVEKIVIRAALEKVDFVQTDAADFLGINRNTLAKKIKQYGLSQPRQPPVSERRA